MSYLTMRFLTADEVYDARTVRTKKGSCRGPCSNDVNDDAVFELIISIALIIGCIDSCFVSSEVLYNSSLSCAPTAGNANQLYTLEARQDSI